MSNTFTTHLVAKFGVLTKAIFKCTGSILEQSCLTDKRIRLETCVLCAEAVYREKALLLGVVRFVA